MFQAASVFMRQLLASDRRLETPDFFPTRFDIAFLKGDQAAVEREVTLAQGKPGAEDAIPILKQAKAESAKLR